MVILIFHTRHRCQYPLRGFKTASQMRMTSLQMNIHRHQKSQCFRWHLLCTIPPKFLPTEPQWVLSMSIPRTCWLTEKLMQIYLLLSQSILSPWLAITRCLYKSTLSMATILLQVSFRHQTQAFHPGSQILAPSSRPIAMPTTRLYSL